LATDLGVMMDLDRNFTMGFTLQNLGTNITYIAQQERLPVTTRLGINYHRVFTNGVTGVFAADLVKTNDRAAAMHVGAEYFFFEMVFLRLGYMLGYEEANSTAGLGIRWRGLHLDFATGLMTTLEGLQKLTLTARF